MLYNCFKALVSLALVFGTAASAQAAELRFTLQGVTFEEAASASGFFQFAGPWNVSVEAGQGSTAFDYTPDNSRILPVQDATGLTWYVAADDGERGLRLTFPKPPGGVPRSGQILPLILADSATPSTPASLELDRVNKTSRSITSGFVLVSSPVLAAVPAIPQTSTFAFLSLGLLVFAACRRWIGAPL